MAQAFPYTYYACDCFDSTNSRGHLHEKDADEEERTFDPRSPRANYQLYPLEHLLYCEDCQHVRCPRCVLEETLNWYCPSCLFEVPSSMKFMDEDIVYSMTERHSGKASQPITTRSSTTSSLISLINLGTLALLGSFLM